MSEEIKCNFCKESDGVMTCGKCGTKNLCYDCSKLCQTSGESICPICKSKS